MERYFSSLKLKKSIYVAEENNVHDSYGCKKKKKIT